MIGSRSFPSSGRKGICKKWYFPDSIQNVAGVFSEDGSLRAICWQARIACSSERDPVHKRQESVPVAQDSNVFRMRLYAWAHGISVSGCFQETARLYGKSWYKCSIIMRGLFMGASVMKSNMKVQYEIIRKKGKRRLTLRITDDARIVVTIPPKLPMKNVEDFIYSHSEWIAKNLVKVKDLPQPLAAHTYEDGDIFLVLGNEVMLGVRESLELPLPRYDLTEDKLLVFVKRKSEKLIKEAILDFYQKLGLRLYQEAVGRWVETLELFPHQRPTSLQMVNYPKRMGCCSKNRELRFALRSLMLPEILIEYLALHEVAHLVHFNHGKDFKDLLTIHMPDWKNHRKNLSLLRNRTARL